MTTLINFAVMSNYFFALLLSFLVVVIDSDMAIGQVVLDHRSFPIAGDTILFRTDNAPENIDLLRPGKDRKWNFAQLSSIYTYPVIVSDLYSSKRSLPNVYLNIQYGKGSEVYVQKTANGLLETGGIDSEIIPNIALAYEVFGVSTYRPSRLTYDKSFSEEYTRRIVINANELALSGVRIKNNSSDSIRIDVKTKANTKADATGLAYFKTYSSSVLRVRTDIVESIQLYEKSNGAWVKINRSKMAFELNTMLPERRSYSFYDYFSDISILPLVHLVQDESGNLLRADYQVDIMENPLFLISDVQNIVAYPNPTFGDIRFELVNYPTGKYRVEVYNIIGKKLWTKSYNVDNAKVIKENFSFLKKGTYLYSIFDSNENKLATKRIAIITP